MREVCVNYRLSPSDLTFLYDGCKHCFVLRVKHGISQPSIPLPGIFSIIASLQKDYYSDKRTELVSPQLPPGIVKHGEKRVCSRELSFPDCSSTCVISGRFDIVAELDDETYAVMDFKTGNSNDAKSAMYARQLHAYAIALERPAPNALELSPVSKMGLLYFAPDQCGRPDASRQVLAGPMTWIEIARDDARFMDFLQGVIRLLDGPLPPPDRENCDWCKYRDRTAGFVTEQSGTTSQPKTAMLPTCPQCQAPMRRRTGKRGEFWGCSNFPNCRGTREI